MYIYIFIYIYIYIYIYILNITCHHMPKYFQVSGKKHPNKHILVLRYTKHHKSVFSYDKGC